MHFLCSYYGWAAERIIMKAIRQNRRFSIQTGFVTLACLALTPSAYAANFYTWGGSNGTARYFSQMPAETALQPLRDGESPALGIMLVADNTTAQKLIEECQDNFGTDCEKQVDTEQMSPASRRQQMIDDCRNNFGTDCEKQVDTELGAEQLDGDRQTFRVPANEK
jgi:hypothetical protein